MSEIDRVRDALRITCADAVERMTDFLDAALTSDDHERLSEHLAGCQACAVYLDQLRQTVTIVGTIRGNDHYRIDDETMDALLALRRQP